jgi:hypothetical protein
LSTPSDSNGWKTRQPRTAAASGFNPRLFTALCALAWLLNQINTGGMFAAALDQGDMNSLAIDMGLLLMVAMGTYTACKIVTPNEAFECT